MLGSIDPAVERIGTQVLQTYPKSTEFKQKIAESVQTYDAVYQVCLDLLREEILNNARTNRTLVATCESESVSLSDRVGSFLSDNEPIVKGILKSLDLKTPPLPTFSGASSSSSSSIPSSSWCVIQ